MKFKVGALIQVIEDNRAAHRAIFLEALEGYKYEAEAQLHRWIDEIRNGKLGQQYLSLPIPMDHTKEYDQVIKMLEMTTDKEIELSQADFARYVMDDWEWKREFIATSANYVNQAG